MNSLVLLNDVKEYLSLKETLRLKTEKVDQHYRKLDHYWRIEENKDHDLYGFNSWFKISLKKTINPKTGEVTVPYVKIFFSRRVIDMSLRDLVLPKSELDNTTCSQTVKTAEYLLTNCADEFMLKIQDRLSKEKTKVANKRAKGIFCDCNFVYALESFYALFVSLRSCILDNPNKITMGKVAIS